MITRAVKLVEDNAIESALRTISMERAGLAALEDALKNGLSEPFCKAIETIGESNGRLIITGVGKSGHIGAKLAATFASTGTPAFFVHAAEANHGDLGMIGGDDVVLAISKGGESAELRSIINYSRRFSIPLIALTCSEKSSLAQASDIVLLVPNEQEACPLGLAPTTSTLMQLALGDALAVALLEARNFTAGDFKVFHPGGKLGASLTLVADIMHTGERLPLVGKGTAMPEAVSVLSRKHFGCVGVLDEEAGAAVLDRVAQGAVREGDHRRAGGQGLARHQRRRLRCE